MHPATASQTRRRASLRAPRAPGRALCALFERRPGRAFQRPTAPGVYSRLRRRMYKSGRKTMRAIARDEPRPHASPYRRISRLRAPLQAPIESNGGKNGIQQTTGAPAVSFHYSLGYDVKLHRPVWGYPRRALGTAGAGGVRGDAPSPNALVTRPAPSTPPNLAKAELRAIRARPHTSDDARMASTHCASPATSDKISRPRSITGPTPATASYRRRRRRRRRRRTASAPTATQHAF